MNSSPPRRATVSLVADGVAQPPAERRQQLVADRMAERVVDDLEAVEVEEQHAPALPSPARAARARCCEPVVEQRAVGQAGQRVVGRVYAICSSAACAR